ncbi:PRP1 splicing factor, N-terminal-domain-containing protein [Lentinula novae-zelandiae]|nr:PRP1 splicing factor, N-terminal-domain-containing protein [Lentinula novae-zelandiae]
MASNKPNKLAFLSMPAPASYVAGLGRGASGFTTRSDIGPTREGPSAEVITWVSAFSFTFSCQDPDNEYGLFAGTAYEKDDEEADKIYEAVDAAMDARRKARREAQEQAQLAKHRAERPKIQQQFADLKRGFSAVTDEEWESIPEVGNLTKRKRPKYERTYAVSDSILAGDRSRGEYENSLDSLQQQAIDKILSLKLDQVSGTSTSSGLSTSIDPKGYLTSLNSIVLKSDAEIGDIKRAQHAGRMVAARKLIKQGCEQCSKNEDVWLEAARLYNNEDTKVIFANAVQHVGQSVKIWLAAADLEYDVKSKRRSGSYPNSARVWKETVNR